MYQSDNHYGPTKADTIRTDKNTLVKDVLSCRLSTYLSVTVGTM